MVATAPRESRVDLSSGLPLLSALLPVALLVPLGAAQGGYFPVSWGWAALALSWAAALALVCRRRIDMGLHELLLVGGLVALAGWIALSAIWSTDLTASVLEIERVLVYALGGLAVLLLVRRRTVPYLLGGTLVAIVGVATFSLATRLFPKQLTVYDPTLVYRLSQPIGYWNGLALFCVLGTLLALGFAARGRRIPVRALAAAAPVVLVPTIYFTFGRAAWIALGVGVGAALLLDPRRLQLATTLVVIAPAPVLAVSLSSRSPALTHSGSALQDVVHDGRGLARWLVLLALLASSTGVTVAITERRVQVPGRLRQAYGLVLILVLAAGLAGAFMRYGGPDTLARKAYEAFSAPSPLETNLNRRLLSFSGNGRADFWRLAWNDAREHPWVGSGAGSYERYYLANKPPKLLRVRDAHSLYVETLAELGPVGLALLVAALVVPLFAAVRARHMPVVPVAFGAYVAFLGHAGVDWDWEQAAITLAGLLCACGIVVAARGARSSGSFSLGGKARVAGVAAVVTVSSFAGVGLVGNIALSSSLSARDRGNWSKATDEARRAISWMPWSADPWDALGRAELGAGEEAAARRSFREALTKDSADWAVWYDLARASRGRTRRSALARVAALYPRAGALRRPRGDG